MKRKIVLLTIAIAIGTGVVRAGYAQQVLAPSPPTGGTSLQDSAKDARNPFEDSIKVPIQFTVGFGVGPEHNVGETLNLEPAIPFSLNSDWDLIARPNQNLTYAPGPNAQFGLQDLQTSFFLTPARNSEWIWGIGPIFEIPSATSRGLGTGRWSAGPTMGLVYSNGPWFNALLTYHLMSFGGDRNRGSINQTYIEPLISYSLDSGWTAQCDPQMTLDWTANVANAWTIPMGADVGKTFQIGGRTTSFQVGAYDLMKHANGAPEWIVRAQLTLLFPPPSRW